jgi:integral membrane protein
MQTRSKAVRQLRIVSILETLSFVVLLGMMLTHNEGGVSVVGMIHGLLFMAYAVIVLKDREVFGWSLGFVAVAILTGPLGAILVLERLRSEKPQLS